MNSPTKTIEVSTRRRLRWLATIVLCGVGVWLAADTYLSQRRVERLVSEIRAAHAHVSWPQSPLQQLLHGSWPSQGGGVHFALGWNIEPGWLREHDYLCGLNIERVSLCERAPSQIELEKLVQLHPIQGISAREYASEIAGTLTHCRTLQRVDFEQSDLGDSGFSELPLEQLSQINIAHTSVSSRGLQSLNRCQNLTTLAIDSSQLDAAVSVLIESKKPIETLEVLDSKVADRHLRRLHELHLRHLSLRGGAVSDDAIELLKQQLPDCVINFN